METYSLFNLFLFLIFLALTANFIVDKVSWKSDFYNEHVVIIDVFVLLDKESFKILVNFEFRYGIC